MSLDREWSERSYVLIRQVKRSCDMRKGNTAPRHILIIPILQDTLTLNGVMDKPGSIWNTSKIVV